MDLGVWEAFLAPRGGLGRSPISQRLQRHLQPKASLKSQYQRPLARARFVYFL